MFHRSLQSALHTARANRPALSWQEALEAFLPEAKGSFGACFRHLRGEAKDEAMAESLGHLTASFRRLWEQRKLFSIPWKTLAYWAMRRTSGGRSIGRQGKGRESRCIMTRCPEKRRYDAKAFARALTAKRSATPPEIVQPRLDYAAYVRRLSPVFQRVAELALAGNRTGDIAKMLGVPDWRISKIRRAIVEGYLRWTNGEKES